MSTRYSSKRIIVWLLIRRLQLQWAIAHIYDMLRDAKCEEHQADGTPYNPVIRITLQIWTAENCLLPKETD